MRANSLPAARGWNWWVAGLKLWQRSPGVIGLVSLLLFLVPGILGSIPVVGALLICIAAPFLNVAVLRVCHGVASGRKVLPADLIIRSPQRLRGLVILGVVTFLVAILSQVLISQISGNAMEQLMAANKAALDAMATQSAPSAVGTASAPLAADALAKTALPANVVLALCINITVISLVGMVMWIAPALTAFAGVPPVKSLFFSIVSCWRNKGAFLVFGVSVFCVLAVASLLMLFGAIGQMMLIMVAFGVLMPASMASNYVSLGDIFGPLFDAEEARGA